MRIKNYLLPGGVMLLGIFAATKFILAKRLSFEIDDVSFSGNILQPSFRFNLIAVNPTKYSANVQNINLRVFANEEVFVGDIYSEIGATVQPEKRTVIPMYANVSFKGLLQSIKYVIGESSTKFTLVGYATVDNIRVPIKVSNNDINKG